jgi:cell shape-determining protein MreC
MAGKARFPAGVAVVGFALLALTPTAPGFLRDLDLVFVHLFRVIDLPIVAAHRAVANSRGDGNAGEGLPAELRTRIRDGVARWDRLLRSGIERYAPELRTTIARVVAVDRLRRRLVIDAGPGVELRVGDPVAAGDVAVGRVIEAGGGLAVVETPWSRDARFAAGCVTAGGGEQIRFVSRGLARRESLAAVSNPERREGLVADYEVIVPNVDDLLPPGAPRLPPGLRLGRLELDERILRISAEHLWLVRPALDIELLDAVAVGFEASRRHAPGPYFEDVAPAALSCAALSPWRDGLALTGKGLEKGAAVVAADRLIGTIEDALLGAARVRGVFDPGQRLTVLIVTPRDAFPAELEVRRLGGGFAELQPVAIPSDKQIEEGDLVLAAGRGMHRPRALYVGEVEAVRDGRVVMAARRPDPTARTFVFRRVGAPADPWRPARRAELPDPSAPPGGGG